MSSKPELSRRGALAAMGAAVLGGCSTNDDDDNVPEPETSTPNETRQENETPTETPEPTETEQEKEDEEVEEQESFTWQDIIDHEQEYIEGRYDWLKTFGRNQDILQQALNGEPVGENYSHKLENWETSYSHGGQSWDLDHFTNMNLNDVDEFQDIMNDAVTLGIHHYAEQIDYPGPSEASGNAARTAQLLIEDLIQQGEFEEHNLHLFGAGNDNHGFTYALSEQHGLYLIDSTSERSGPAGEGVLSDRSGYDRITTFNWNEVRENRTLINSYTNFVSNSLYTTSEPAITNVRYNLDLIPEAVKIFDDSTIESGQFLMNTLRPAKATLTHEYIDEEYVVGEDIIMLNPDSLRDLPDFREYGEENFEEYRKDLSQYTEVIDAEDRFGKTHGERN